MNLPKQKKSRVKYPRALLVRMTNKEKQKLEKAARSGGKGEGEIVRILINGHLPG